MKNKDCVFTDFLEMIKKSWTYERLTEEEQAKIHCILLDSRTSENITGSYNQRWKALNALYYAFLIALDYTPTGWREPADDTIPLF